MSWSPFKPEIIEDPGNGHQYLLSECPVHKCEEFDPPFYTLSRYADVEAALRDIETYSSHYGQGPRFSDPVGMLCDPPRHTYTRGLVQSAFGPPAMRALRPVIEQLTEELIDGICKGEGEFDLHDDFAFPLPVIIIAGMLGVPQEDLERFKYWSDVQVAAMGAEDPSIYADDQAAFVGYMHNHMMTRRNAIVSGEAVPDDLLTLVSGAKEENGDLLPESDALSMLNQLLVGGNETTTSLITNMMWRLLQDPTRYAEVVANPDLAEAAVEESLRFDPPVLGLYRNTTRPVELHGEVILEGVKVLINYAAANRDPEVFENPDHFDLHRPKKRHMGFGLGVHFCLGAPMARLEAEIALKAMARRLPDLKLISAGERIAPFFLWGRKRLPVSWK